MCLRNSLAAWMFFEYFMTAGEVVRGCLARGPIRVVEVRDVLPHGLALLVLDLLRVALGEDVDARAVEGGAELSRVEGAVVGGVVPPEPALVAGVLPERGHPLDGVHGVLAVEHYLLARLVRLHAPERPEKPMGLPFCLRAAPILRHSSKVLGGAEAPTEANHDRR